MELSAAQRSCPGVSRGVTALLLLVLAAVASVGAAPYASAGVKVRQVTGVSVRWASGVAPQVAMTWRPVRGASGYEVRLADATRPSATLVTRKTRARSVVLNLRSDGTPLTIRVRAYRGRATGAWSKASVLPVRRQVATPAPSQTPVPSSAPTPSAEVTPSVAPGATPSAPAPASSSPPSPTSVPSTPAAPTAKAQPAPVAPATADPSYRGIPRHSVFSPLNVWQVDVTHAARSARSATQVANIAGLARTLWNGHPGFNTDSYGVAWYTVAKDQPRTRVRFYDCQGKNYIPSGLYGTSGAFESVPIPDDAVPTGGSDAQLTVYQPATDTLWDFWVAGRDQHGWFACWGGKIENVSTNLGYFTSPFGASASGMAHQLGAVSIADVKAGRIDHAIGLELPMAAVGPGISYPAQRSDGMSTAASAVPMGTRLRLDPSLDLSGLGLTPIGTMVAKAAQRYGFIVADRSGAVAIKAESSDALRSPTGVSPWGDLLGSTPSWGVLDNFPWEKLDVLEPDLKAP